VGDSWDPRSVDDAVQRLCSLPEPPTAVFAANDSLAFRAMGVLRMAGCRVPEDVALVGFDDIPLAEEMIPPLTTVRIPLDEIGRRASQRLLQLVESGQQPNGASDVITAELVRRGTA
jgi:LacI family transcriptional regulator